MAISSQNAHQAPRRPTSHPASYQSTSIPTTIHQPGAETLRLRKPDAATLRKSDAATLRKSDAATLRRLGLPIASKGRRHPFSAIFGSVHPISRRWYQNPFLICFFAGLLAGTAAANFLYASLYNQAGYYLNLLSSRSALDRGEQVSLFGAVCRQRVIETLIAWLVGLTVYAVPFFCLICFGMGLSAGLVLSVITGRMGLMGLPFFAASILPQALLYVPVICLFLWRSLRGGGRLKLVDLLLALVVVIAGCASEVWLNPHVMSGIQALLSVTP